MEKMKELIPYIVILILVILLKLFIVTPIRVNGTSMMNTLHPKDIMILNKTAYLTKNPKRFDIVVVRLEDEDIIKRVIGLPGEVIEYKDNTLYVNGKKVEEKDIQLWHIASAAGAVFCFLIVAGVTPDAFTSVSAAKSLLNGEAQAYRAQEQERVAILEDTSIENAELKEFQNKPYLLFYEDIEADTNNWKNVRMSSYYRKNSVILIESETE